MVLYSWRKIYNHTKHSSKELLNLLHYITFKPIPLNRKDPVYHYSKIDWSGNSFILNPEAIFESKEYSLKELIEYVGLASLRNYAEYKISGKTTLDLEKNPLPKENLKTNRLLRVENGQIHFLLEEGAKGKTNGSI